MPPGNSHRHARRMPESTSISAIRPIVMTNGCENGLGAPSPVAMSRTSPTSTIPMTRALQRKMVANNLVLILPSHSFRRCRYSKQLRCVQVPICSRTASGQPAMGNQREHSPPGPGVRQPSGALRAAPCLPDSQKRIVGEKSSNSTPRPLVVLPLSFSSVFNELRQPFILFSCTWICSGCSDQPQVAR